MLSDLSHLFRNCEIRGQKVNFHSKISPIYRISSTSGISSPWIESMDVPLSAKINTFIHFSRKSVTLFITPDYKFVEHILQLTLNYEHVTTLTEFLKVVNIQKYATDGGN